MQSLMLLKRLFWLLSLFGNQRHVLERLLSMYWGRCGSIVLLGLRSHLPRIAGGGYGAAVSYRTLLLKNVISTWVRSTTFVLNPYPEGGGERKQYSHACCLERNDEYVDTSFPAVSPPFCPFPFPRPALHNTVLQKLGRSTQGPGKSRGPSALTPGGSSGRTNDLTTPTNTTEHKANNE